MTKETFLSQLGSALSGNMDSGKVNENLRYYSEYISGEVQGGKTEEEVLQMLGDPWILARTLIDADNGTDRETVYEAGGTYENQSAGRNRNGDAGGTSYGGKERESGKWWKKLLLVLFVIMIVLLVFAIISGVIRIFAPFVLPILLVIIVIRILKGKRR